MKTVEIRELAGIAGLREEWNGLLDATGSNSIFLTWEWLQSWWPAYAEPGWQLRIVLLYDDGGALRGLVALREQRHSRHGLAARTLRFAVDGSNDSEYLDVLVHPEGAEATRAALANWLERELAHGVVLQWNEIPEDSSTLAALRALCESNYVAQAVACATAALPADFEGYLLGLKPRFRTKVRSVLRSLTERDDVEFGYCQTPVEAAALLPPLFELHTRRWEADGERGVFWWPRKRDFYRDLTARLANDGTLRFSWLRVHGQVLACQYGFLRGGTYFHLQEGYEPEAEHMNCGIGLRAWSIRELIRQGIREYDFLGGINRHKTDWGAVEKRSISVEAAGPGWKNWAFRSAPAWETAVRESARAVLPDRVFELRHQLAAFRPSGAAWRGAASVYYHSGVLPALARRVRDRYTLVRNGVSGGPKVHLENRRAPQGRILYFHRVNNEGDPFFPAMDTALFDRQMRYLSRHYRVVSLAEMLRRLDSGEPGDTVAITFDDGYRDNFEHALPVLERYGLPATIFLTTEPMDTREPMWFERLAGGLRDTACERVDVEIDVPRRYLLRNVQERLRANDRIYEQLRQLPNAERVMWLERILDQLGRPSLASRQGRMLTWEDARQMMGRGIDFGGHTVTHPFLSRLPGEGILAEAAGCRARIEAELQQPARHFAYPSGRAEDFGLDNTQFIRAAGYEAAVTTIWGLNDASTDRMTLRRGGPWEERADLFAAKLDWYQLVNG